MADEVGEMKIVISADTSKLDSDLQGKLGKSAEKGGGVFSSGFGKAMKVGVLGAAASVGGTAAGILGTAMAKGFARAGAIEEAEAKLKGLGHTAEGITGIMDNVKASVRGTAFGLGDAAGVAASMVAAGIKPGEDLTKTLAVLGDTATITGASFGEMGSIYSKIAGSGKLTGESLAQLRDRGLPVIQMLSDEYKISADEAQKWVSSGKVSFEMFRDLMEKNIGGAAQNSGKTFKGAAANIGAALGRLGEKFAKPIMDTMRDSFNAAIPALDAVGELLDPIAQKFGEVLAEDVLPRVQAALKSLPDLFERVSGGITRVQDALAGFSGKMQNAFTIKDDGGQTISLLDRLKAGFEQVKNIVLQFASGFMEGFGGVGPMLDSLTGIVTALTGPFGLLKAVLVDLFKQIDWKAFGKVAGSVLGTLGSALGTITSQVVSMVSSVITPLLPVLGNLVSQLLPVIVGLIDKLAPVIANVVGVAGQFLAQLVSGLAPVLTKLISSVLPPVISLIDSLSGVVIQVLDAVMPLVSTLLDALVPAVVAVVDAVVPFVSQLIDALVPAIEGIVSAALPPLMSAFDAVAQLLNTVVVPAFKWLTDFLIGHFTTVWNSLKPLVDTVLGFISKTVDNVMKYIQGAINVVMGIISGDWSRAWEGIKQVFSAIWDQIKNIASSAWNALKDGLNYFGAGLSSLWSGIWDGIKNVGQGAWDWIVSAAEAAWNALSDSTLGVFNGIKDAVSEIWNGIKRVIGTPINAVIGFINGGIIGGYNAVANFLKLGTLPPIPELALQKGGLVDLPWSASRRDPYLGVTPRGAFRFEGEEFFVNRAQTKKNRRLLEAINSGRVNQSDFPGFAEGGWLGNVGSGVQSSIGSSSRNTAGTVNFRGHRFTALFASLIQQAEKMAGRMMHISQGGFRPRTSYSGTSHAGDALDITGSGHQYFIPFLRQLGIPTWDRTGKGNWVSHSHGVPLPGSGRAGGSAIWQAQDYLRGGDGLGGRDNGPRGGMLQKVIDGIMAALAHGFDSVAGWFNSIVGNVSGWFNDSRAKLVGTEGGKGPWGEVLSGVMDKLWNDFRNWLGEQFSWDREVEVYSVTGSNNHDKKKDENAGTVRGHKVARAYASGTSSAWPGLALVGEGGPEMINLRGGERITNARLTRELLLGTGGGSPIVIQNLSLPGIDTLERLRALLYEIEDERRINHMNGAY